MLPRHFTPVLATDHGLEAPEQVQARLAAGTFHGDVGRDRAEFAQPRERIDAGATQQIARFRAEAAEIVRDAPSRRGRATAAGFRAQRTGTIGAVAVPIVQSHWYSV